MAKPAEDIISLPIEIMNRLADSKFRLVHIASQRVRQLSAGEPPIVATRSIKDTTVALEESLTGAFKVIIGEDARTAKEEEIRKELSAYLSETGAEDVSGEEGLAESEELAEGESGEEPAETEAPEEGEE